MENNSEASNPHDRLLTVTRVLAAFIVPVLVTAFVMLYFFPNNSGQLFAWPVKPMMSAMMLGATYIGGAYFFSMVVLARRWHTVRLGFIPVSVFAGILGVSTVLHWDKFTQGHISFILWAFLYFVLPFVIPVVWYLNQRTNRGEPDPRTGKLPASLTMAAAVLGTVMILVSLVLLIAPQILIPSWGWTLSPLTGRIVSAMFALSGLVALGVASDRHWSSVRIVMGAQNISIVLFLVALIPAQRDIQWSSWGAWLFIGGLLVALALNVWAFLAARKAQLVAAQPVTA
jgi:hypothetical protein